MKKALSDFQRLRKHAPAMRGVFTLSDIVALMAEPHRNELHRRISRLEEAGALTRFARGIYTTEGFSPYVLSQKLRPNSYISFGNVLADARLIGSVPAFQVDAVALGRSRSFPGQGLTLRFFGIHPSLYCGYQTTGGVAIASPEKALLDTLYFHQHGARFYFDIFSDVNVASLSRAELDALLVKYKNPKFKTFVKEYLDGRGLAQHR